MGRSHAIPEPKLCSTDTILSIPISAKSSNSLAARVHHTKALLLDADSRATSSLTFTLAQKRPKLHSRALLLAKAYGAAGPVELIDEDEPTAAIDPSSKGLPFAFIFTGQGAQYPEVGKRLLECNALFRRTIRELDAILRTLPSATAPSWTIEQTLTDSPGVSRVHDVTRSQPVCTAIQIGLVDLLRAWGVDASAVVGHSSGEIAAAYAAGFLDAKQALLVAYFRGLAVGGLRTEGGMVAVGVGPEEAGLLISKLGLEKELCVACVNSPASVTFSGSDRAAECLLEELKATKTFGKKLSTGGRAYHSSLVKQVGQMYEDLLRPYLQDSDPLSPSGVKMFSSVGYETGQSKLFPKQARNPRYWRDNLERSVQFSGALHILMEEGKSHDGYHLIEIGPHSALKGAIRQVCTAGQFDVRRFPYNATLIRGQDDELAIKRLVKSLYLHDHDLNWEYVNNIAPQDQVARLDLAPYPWDYSAGLPWYESRLSTEMRNRKYPRHELLGSAQLGGNGIDWSWRNIFRLHEAEWLSDHMIEGQIVFPATGYLAIAMEAISQVLGVSRDDHNMAFEFRNVTINTALIVHDDASAGAKETEIHTTLSPQKISNTHTSGNWFQYSISSWIDGRPNLHCSGSVRLTTTNLSPCPAALVQDLQHLDKWTMGMWYKKLADEGFLFGPSFQSLTSLETDRNRTSTRAIAHTSLKTRVGTSTDTVYPVHPVTIDACLQAAIMGSTAGNIEDLKGFMPAFIKECRIQALDPARHDDAVIYTSTTTTGFCTKRASSTLVDAAGSVLVDMKDVRLALHSGRMDQQEPGRCLNGERHPTLRISWKPDILRLPAGPRKHLNSYISKFKKQLSCSGRARPPSSDLTAKIGAVLDLVGHNNPSFRALEVTAGHEKASEYWLSLLKPDASLPRIRSWDTASLLGDNTLKLEDDASKTFDAVVLSNKELSHRLWKHAPNQVLSLLGDLGVVVTPVTDAAIESLNAAQFTIINVEEQLILGIKQAHTESRIQGKDVLIVVSFFRLWLSCSLIFYSIKPVHRRRKAFQARCHSI